MLERANVAKARAIVVLTDNDLANLEIALGAREVNPRIKVILRMFNERLGKQLVETFGFDAVFSTAALAAPSFSSALYSSKILQTIEVGTERRVHLAKLTLAKTSPLVGKSILDLEEGSNVSVVLHNTQGRKELLPAIEGKVYAGDEVFVLAELDALDVFDRLTQGASG